MAEDNVPEEHAHTWQPMPGEFSRYTCGCGATGYRKGFGSSKGQILPHKIARSASGTLTHVGPSNISNGNARRGKRGPGEW